MKKGKYGIILAFYAVLAFLLAILNQTLLCGLLLGFVLIAEQDEWTIRQVLQAFLLSLFTSLLSNVLSIFSIFTKIPFIGFAISGIIQTILSLISLVIFILAIIAITKVVKGKDASIPGINKFVNWAYGIVVKKVYTNSDNSTAE